MVKKSVAVLNVLCCLSVTMNTFAADAACDGPGTISVTPVPLDPAVKEHFFHRQVSSSVLVDPGYRIWGFSVMKWKDGKYHGYYSRWPESRGHAGWMTHCEIAHAVADKPEGPFKTTGTVLASRNASGWDRVNAHNPAVCVAGGKICLYYISDNLKGKFESEGNTVFPSDRWLKQNRTTVRNSQCIGVAIADHPAGPFVRAGKPVVEPHGVIKNIAVNPAVLYRENQFVMIIKGDDVKKEEKFRIQLVGHSARPDGPFVFREEPVYSEMQTEDAGIWYDQQDTLYYMICHVMGKPDLIAFHSVDSIHWKLNKDPVMLKKQILLSDGSLWKPARVERPFVLTDDNGKPCMIYLAVLDRAGGKDINGNIAIPLKIKQ